MARSAARPGRRISESESLRDRHLLKPLAARALAVPLILASLVTGAAGQASFRVTYKVTGTTPTHTEFAGTVYNDSRADAADVSVTVEAVGANGKALARGVSYVASQIREGGSSGFKAKVPIVPGTTGFRASVTSFRFTQSYQGP